MKVLQILIGNTLNGDTLHWRRHNLYMWLEHSSTSMTMLPRGSHTLRKTILSKTRIGEDQKSSKIVITLNRAQPLTREMFVIDALKSAGDAGLFVNALLRGWNAYREKIGKPRSNYAAFRKLVWSMKKREIIECIPDGNKVPRKDRKGKEMFTRSYYRLTQKHLASWY